MNTLKSLLCLILLYAAQARYTNQHQLGERKSCGDCVSLISTLTEILNSSSTDEQAEMELNAIDCTQFGSARGICEHLMTFTPQMLDIIILGEDPRTICTNIRRCHPTVNVLRPLTPIETENRLSNTNQLKVNVLQDLFEVPVTDDHIEQNKLGEVNMCDDCINLFSRLEQDLNASSTVKDVEQELDSVLCSQVQGRKHFCERAMKRLAPRVMRILSGGEDPTTICISMKRCQPNSNLQAVDPPTRKQCKTCQNFMRDMMNKQETDIISYTAAMKDQLCSRLSGESVLRCNESVEAIEENLINNMKSRDITQICINMEMCPVPENEVARGFSA